MLLPSLEMSYKLNKALPFIPIIWCRLWALSPLTKQHRYDFFLSCDQQLYRSLCLLVGRSVGWLVHKNVPTFWWPQFSKGGVAVGVAYNQKDTCGRHHRTLERFLFQCCWSAPPSHSVGPQKSIRPLVPHCPLYSNHNFLAMRLKFAMEVQCL